MFTTLWRFRKLASRWSTIAQAITLILFPLLFIVLTTKPVHPILSGPADQQIRQVAEAATRWRLVHFGLAMGSLFGAATVLQLRRGVSGSLLLPAANVAAVGGVGAALVLVGVFWQETIIVASLARTCAAVEACLGSDNKTFYEGFAHLGWTRVPYLGWGGIALVASIIVLGFTAWRARVLRIWEGLLLVLGATTIIVLSPGLHGDAVFGFLGILLGLGSWAARRLWTVYRAPSQ